VPLPAVVRSAQMSMSKYDLTNAEERIAESVKSVDRQRAVVQTLWDNSHDASGAEQLLASMERTLQNFRDHASRIKEDLKHAKEAASAIS
jgi:hypothetical protein